MNILAIIPARSGSKGIKDKNIKNFKGHPMMAWSIKQAIQCKYINKVIVSTDSELYKKIALQYGAEVPFLRPKEISGDLSTDYECIKHCLDNLDSYKPDIIIQLRPTYPTRNLKILNKTIELFLENRINYDSLRTVIPFQKSPMKMYNIENNILNPLFPVYKNIIEPFNRCRQELPQCYLHNGYIDILNAHIINKYHSVTGPKIYPYIMDMDEINDIDSLEDLEKALNK